MPSAGPNPPLAGQAQKKRRRAAGKDKLEGESRIGFEGKRSQKIFRRRQEMAQDRFESVHIAVSYSLERGGGETADMSRKNKEGGGYYADKAIALWGRS